MVARVPSHVVLVDESLKVVEHEEVLRQYFNNAFYTPSPILYFPFSVFAMSVLPSHEIQVFTFDGLRHKLMKKFGDNAFVRKVCADVRKGVAVPVFLAEDEAAQVFTSIHLTDFSRSFSVFVDELFRREERGQAWDNVLFLLSGFWRAFEHFNPRPTFFFTSPLDSLVCVYDGERVNKVLLSSRYDRVFTREELFNYSLWRWGVRSNVVLWFAMGERALRKSFYIRERVVMREEIVCKTLQV
jgi:hypothetical protein